MRILYLYLLALSFGSIEVDDQNIIEIDVIELDDENLGQVFSSYIEALIENDSYYLNMNCEFSYSYSIKENIYHISIQQAPIFDVINIEDEYFVLIINSQNFLLKKDGQLDEIFVPNGKILRHINPEVELIGEWDCNIWMLEYDPNGEFSVFNESYCK